jgi:hypothetical protein
MNEPTQGAGGAGPDGLDLEQLKEYIRSRVERRKAEQAAAQYAPAGAHHFNLPGGTGLKPMIWHRLAASLRVAERHAEVGKDVPAFEHFPQPLRGLARLVARVVMRLSRFLIRRQCDYNHAVLNSLHNISAGLRQLEDGQQRLTRQVDGGLPSPQHPGDAGARAA